MIEPGDIESRPVERPAAMNGDDEGTIRGVIDGNEVFGMEMGMLVEGDGDGPPESRISSVFTVGGRLRFCGRLMPAPSPLRDVGYCSREGMEAGGTDVSPSRPAPSPVVDEKFGLDVIKAVPERS